MKFEPQLLWQVYLDTIITVQIFFLFFKPPPRADPKAHSHKKKIRGRKNKRNWAITSMGTATKRNERACHHRADTCIRDKLQIFHRMLVFRWSIMMGFLGLQNGLAADHVWHDFYRTITGMPTRLTTLELKTVLSARLSSYISQQHGKLEPIPNPLYNLSHCSPKLQEAPIQQSVSGYNPVYMPPTKIFFLMY